MQGISLSVQKMSSLQRATVPTGQPVCSPIPSVYILSYCSVNGTMDNGYLRKGEKPKAIKSWILKEETVLPACCVLRMTNQTSLESLNSCCVLPNSSRLN